jgi:hypothetical protein
MDKNKVWYHVRIEEYTDNGLLTRGYTASFFVKRIDVLDDFGPILRLLFKAVRE